MIESLTKLISFCYRLLSTLCHLLITFGYNCQPTNGGNRLMTNNVLSGAHRGPNGSCSTTSSSSPLPPPSSSVSHNCVKHNSNQLAHTHNHHQSSNGKLQSSSSPSSSLNHNLASIKSSHAGGGGHQNGFAYKSNGYLANGYNNHYQNGVIANGKSQSSHQSTLNGTESTASNNNNNHHHHQNNNGNHSNGSVPVSVVKLPPYSRPIVPFLMLLSNYLCHTILYLFGHLNDQLRRMGLIASVERVERNRSGYAELYSSFATFYIRNIIQRMINMWCHPISSVPGATIEILDRKFSPYNASWKYTGDKFTAINMGSYNYLGYAENDGPRIKSVEATIQQHGVGLCSVPNELGIFKKYLHLEKQIAQFLGVEDSIVIGMGFATNALGLPCLFGPGCLVISDENNHASLILGCRLSGAKVRVFKHNDMTCLEKVLRSAVLSGQSAKGPNGKSSLPWKKIVILVEGIYSMEGTIVNLPEVIRLKRKYKAYLYMDEAHSIGAMGPRGRGICDYFDCDPQDVDLLMGTFTKSFAAAGGYIAGPRHIINYFRASSASFYYATTMAPPIIEQISYILDEFLLMDKNNNRHHSYFENGNAIFANRSPLKNGFGLGGDNHNHHHNVIASKGLLSDQIRLHKFCDVQSRIVQLRKNALYFRMKLKQFGFHIEGHDDSPVVPIMVYSPANLKCLISELLAKGIASTGAAYPVTSLVGIRARFCLSAAHTDEMINYTLACLDEIGDRIGIKFDKPQPSSSPSSSPLQQHRNKPPAMQTTDQYKMPLAPVTQLCNGSTK